MFAVVYVPCVGINIINIIIIIIIIITTILIENKHKPIYV